MRAVIQRVKQSKVTIHNKGVASIGPGVLVLLGVGNLDTTADAEYLAAKVVNLRIFEDSSGKMNRSLLETGGEMLVVSQFTLYGDCRKGRRPSYVGAARPEAARTLYEYFIRLAADTGVGVQSGRFQALMAVSLINDGPVTLIVESPTA